MKVATDPDIHVGVMIIKVSDGMFHCSAPAATYTRLCDETIPNYHYSYSPSSLQVITFHRHSEEEKQNKNKKPILVGKVPVGLGALR